MDWRRFRSTGGGASSSTGNGTGTKEPVSPAADAAALPGDKGKERALDEALWGLENVSPPYQLSAAGEMDTLTPTSSGIRATATRSCKPCTRLTPFAPSSRRTPTSASLTMPSPERSPLGRCRARPSR